jgi:hypothetical protein
VVILLRLVLVPQSILWLIQVPINQVPRNRFW